MGNRSSFLQNKEDIIFELKAISVKVKPCLLIDSCEKEDDLHTGNQVLDQLIIQRISEGAPDQLGDIFANILGYMVDSVSQIQGDLYVVLQKHDGQIFTSHDVDKIMSLNSVSHKYDPIVLLTEEEATGSPYFDGQGDIRLVYTVTAMDYL